MAGLTQFQSFVGKFVSLWEQGLDARLNVNCSAGQAWVQLHVGLGDAHGPQQQEPQGHVRVPGPARLRRRQRRAEERRKETEKATEASIEKVVVDEAAEKDALRIVQDEICPDAEYKVKVTEKVKKMCSVEFYPQNLEKIEDFRKDIEDYFKERKDIIEEVMDTKIEDFGRKVTLRSVVKIRFAWVNFFNDPAKNYSDLHGIRTVRHGCRNLSDCDPAPS